MNDYRPGSSKPGHFCIHKGFLIIPRSFALYGTYILSRYKRKSTPARKDWGAVDFYAYKNLNLALR